MLIVCDIDGSQTQELRRWKEGWRANDVIWVVVVVVVGDQGAGTAWKKSKRFHFVLRAFEAATVSCKLARRTPPARPVPCLPIGLDPGKKLSGLEALQPRPIEASSHFHCGLDTI